MIAPELFTSAAAGSAACLGDVASDAVDLILWRADDVETIETRVELPGVRRSRA